MSKKIKTTRHLVMHKNDVHQLMNGGDWSVIQTYSAQLADYSVFARDCAKLSGALVVAELDSGEYEVVADYSRVRREVAAK